MAREEILQAVAAMDSLPRLPQVAVRLLEIGMDDRASARDIADIVMEDAGITAYLLKLINSPYYGLRERVTTVSHGIALLGVEVVKNIVLSLAILDVMKHRAADNPALQDYWEQSMYTAAAARQLAEQAGFPQPEQAFIAGLLADIGVLVLWELDPALYRRIVRQGEGEYGNRSVAEKSLYGMDHTEVGVALARIWNLPEVYAGVMALHHSLDLLTDLEDDAVRVLGQMVNLGAVVGSIFVSGEDGFKTSYLKHLAGSLLNLGDRTDKFIDALLVRVSRQMGEMGIGSDLVPLSKKSYLKILQDSNRKLGENNLRLTGNMLTTSHARQQRRELIAMVSEDMKSPLSAIIGYSSHLLAQNADQSSAEARLVGEIYRNGKDALEMVNECGKIMAMEDDALVVAPLHKDARSLVDAVLEMVGERARQRGVMIERNLDAAVSTLSFDEHKLGYVLAHLLDLALSRVATGGRIVISDDVLTETLDSVAAVPQHLYELRIDAEGRPAPRAPVVADDGSRRKYTATADYLRDSGLYLSRSIITSHGGRLRTEQEEDLTSFVIQLPVHRLAAESLLPGR
ncbi:MAG: HDOD domain-containing protein [Deltaproteobacteria bacterium]|nr:HDOD domain-containing protein [Candidatus Anaeroferrophillacea bacterium]